jgi:hypothetical protein
VGSLLEKTLQKRTQKRMLRHVQTNKAFCVMRHCMTPCITVRSDPNFGCIVPTTLHEAKFISRVTRPLASPESQV